MIVSGGLFSAPNHAAGTNTNDADEHDVRHRRRAEHRAQPVVLSARARSRTSLTASMFSYLPAPRPLLRDDADLLDAGFLQPAEHVHQFLQLHRAVAAQEHLLVGAGLHRLAHPLGQHVDRHGLLVDDRRADRSR